MGYKETKVQIYYLKYKLQLLEECISSEPFEVNKIKLYRKRKILEKEVKKLSVKLRKEKSRWKKDT